jgi:hypothetical protein
MDESAEQTARKETVPRVWAFKFWVNSTLVTQKCFINFTDLLIV